jgi:superfamily II DNA or RNA helicase
LGTGDRTMPGMNEIYNLPPDLVLGQVLNSRVPEPDQIRQRAEVEEILRRLHCQPGVILADEVGMGKTFVALAIAYAVASNSPRGPVIVMVPANLIDKWEQDLKTFCGLYLSNRRSVRKEDASLKELKAKTSLRYGIARHSVDLMKLLDDAPRERCHLIFLAQGAMARLQSDKWIRLALIAEALRRHGRGKADRLIKVKKHIHRFLAEMLWAIGEERAHDWGEDLWQTLLKTDPGMWRQIYNNDIHDERKLMNDDPVPVSVIRALRRIEVSELADALKKMPVRARGGDERISERIDAARQALRKVEKELWKQLLAQTSWRSPLLVMDEAHHLKNPETALARQLQSPDLEKDLHTGDGAMAKAFDRMLFLTATPFQLGHHELVRVLERFGDVRWNEAELGSLKDFHQQLSNLGTNLNETQRTAIALQRSWSRLRLEDCMGDLETWWERLVCMDRESLNSHQLSVIDSFNAAKRSRNLAEQSLRPWIVRHNKGVYWEGTAISRRCRMDGAAVANLDSLIGLPIPPQQLLPFFLAARSNAKQGQDLLGEALSSSYEAFRYTRQNCKAEKDEQEQQELSDMTLDLSLSRWYLGEFDQALKNLSGSVHPKMAATVRKVVDLWESGEKVLVFAFYRQTCRALRIHISQEIENRINLAGQQRLREAGREVKIDAVEKLIDRIQNRFFDDSDSPGRRAVDAALADIMNARPESLKKAQMSAKQCENLTDVMRRFLRVPTTLARCFPLGEFDLIEPSEAVARTLDYADASGLSWRQKFDGFIEFLTEGCSSTEERNLYLDAALRTQTGGIRVDKDEEEDDADPDAAAGYIALANVQVATGKTRREMRSRLMRAFNTPFFPDILVCSEVMGEGVDLQRFCRHVIHHDLDWNPSRIEQRTGRIDRLGCKAEGCHPIVVFLPYLAGTADERQYRVMSDREKWFRIVMGQDEVARLITPDNSDTTIPLPDAISNELSFKLGIEHTEYLR